MEHPYEENHFEPYQPKYSPDPNLPVSEGSRAFATASLVMGILSILSVCCFPLLPFLFAGLGILFSCLSKGPHSRSGPAKAGMAVSSGSFAVMTALVITVCSLVLSSPTGRSFIRDYFNLLSSENPNQEDIYKFLDKYLTEDELPDFYRTPETHHDGNFL